MSKKRWLTTGSVLHPSHERPRRSSGGMVDKVAVSTGGRSTKAAAPTRRSGPLAVDDGPKREGVTVAPIEPSSSAEPLTPAGRFRVTK